jgi:transposase-like protein
VTKATRRARYTQEFKQEAVRLIEGGQSIAAAARTLGVVDQTLFNWVKAHRAGKCVFRRSVTDRFGSVTAEFGSVTDDFVDVTGGRLVAA